MNIKGLWMTVFSLLLLSLVNINMICYAQEDEATDATNPTSHLLESIMNNDSPGIRKALEDGENIDLTNVNGWTGAMFAVAFNNIRILQELIEFGINLNIPDNEGFTPLMRAAQDNNIELVDVLLSGNANPLIETPTGATAFSLAGGRKRVAATIAEACVLFSIEYNNIPSMLTAISNGAYVNIHSQSGYTPVIFAVQQGNLEAVQTLVKRYGSDVDRQENDGWTPLHFAASMGSVEMVKLLLSVGADASLTSINGDTAYDIAVQEDRKDIIPLIPNLKNSEL